MSDTEATAPTEQPAPSTEEQPSETPQAETQPEPEASEPASEPASEQPQEGGGEPEPKEEEKPAEGDEQQPAAEGEAKPEGEGEGEGEKGGEEGEKTEEAKDEKEEEKVEEKEEPIVITPEGNQYWLSTEDVLAKGLPENEVENFKTFYYKHGHSLQAWYEKLKDFTHQTEFITLSKDEVEALSAEGEPSEEQQQVLNGLQDRVNQAIELYGEEGAMVRIGGRSSKDAILDRDEESFIAEVRDDVINNLEVEKQSANAYAIWKDEKHPGAFRRGLTKIRQSLRRRPAAAQKEKPKLEEEEKKEGEEEAPKAEEAAKGEAKPEGEAEPKEEGATGGAEVTVEVEVEQGEEKEEEKPAEEKPSEEEPAAEPKAEEPTPAAEPEAAEQKPEEGEGEKKEGEGEGEAKPSEGEGEKKEGGEDGEIQKVEGGEGDKEGEGEKKEGEEESKPKSKRASHKKKPGEAHHHHYPKSKHDNLDNQIMRAFLKSTGARYRVTNGKEALEMLRKSGHIRRDLNQLKPFCGVEGVQFSMSVTKWDSHIPQYPGMDFRGFVYGNELRALSQYNDSAYFPNVDHYKSTTQIKVENFFKEHIQEALKELENYIIDFFVSPDKIYVVRLNPFYMGTGACLYTWTEHAKVLTRGPFEFRIVTASKTAPEAYSSLQPHWSTMLESVLQSKKDEQRQSSSPRGCVIL